MKKQLEDYFKPNNIQKLIWMFNFYREELIKEYSNSIYTFEHFSYSYSEDIYRLYNNENTDESLYNSGNINMDESLYNDKIIYENISNNENKLILAYKNEIKYLKSISNEDIVRTVKNRNNIHEISGFLYELIDFLPLYVYKSERGIFYGNHTKKNYYDPKSNYRVSFNYDYNSSDFAKTNDKLMNYILDMISFKRNSFFHNDYDYKSTNSKPLELVNTIDKSMIIKFPLLHIVNTELGTVTEDKKYNQVPIYNYTFYTRGGNGLPGGELNSNNEVDALNFNPNINVDNLNSYAKGIFKEEKKKYIENYNIIKNNISNILSNHHIIAVTDIPSSKKNDPIVLDKIIKDLASSNDEIIDATNLLYRKKNKNQAHTDGENRSISLNIETMDIGMDINDISEAEAIVVLDNVVNTGNSFIAANELLKEITNKKIINVAYARKLSYAFYSLFNSDRYN